MLGDGKTPVLGPAKLLKCRFGIVGWIGHQNAEPPHVVVLRVAKMGNAAATPAIPATKSRRRIGLLGGYDHVGFSTFWHHNDKRGKLWFDTMFQGSLGELDPKTGEIKYYPLAPEYNDNRVQLNFIGLRHDVDGNVWTKSVGTQDVFRLDLASGKWERFQPLKELPRGRHSIYQVISDSQNNLWMSEFRQATSARSMQRPARRPGIGSRPPTAARGG